MFIDKIDDFFGLTTRVSIDDGGLSIDTMTPGLLAKSCIKNYVVLRVGASFLAVSAAASHAYWTRYHLYCVITHLGHRDQHNHLWLPGV